MITVGEERLPRRCVAMAGCVACLNVSQLPLAVEVVVRQILLAWYGISWLQ